MRTTHIDVSGNIKAINVTENLKTKTRKRNSHDRTNGKANDYNSYEISYCKDVLQKTKVTLQETIDKL